MDAGVPVELVLAGASDLRSGMDRGANGATERARAGASRVGSRSTAAGAVACMPVSAWRFDSRHRWVSSAPIERSWRGGTGCHRYRCDERPEHGVAFE